MWKGELVFISEAPIGELVSIAELETGDHVVRFCDLDIGLLDAAAPICRESTPVRKCRPSERLNSIC
jgi:hypothetical protein